MLKKYLLIGLLTTGTTVAGPISEIIEENDERWTYSGYWRNSSQGHHGSQNAYAVGNASQMSPENTYSGEAGEGMAYLDLSGYPQSANLELNLCYLQHTKSWRSDNNSAVIYYADGSKINKLFSQIGVKNTKGCHSLGNHLSVVGVSLSNDTSDSKWTSLDYVQVDSLETPVTPDPNYQSRYTQDDIHPTGPLGANLSGFTAITADSLGVVLAEDANFGKMSVPLDDLDGNGIPELLVSVKHQSTNFSSTYLMILYLDANGTVLKYQSLDSIASKDTSWNHRYEPFFMSRAGDFDGNGVKDIVMTENSATLNNKFNILLLGRTDNSNNASYTVLGDVEFSNNRGQLPFVINDGSYFGNWPHALGDLDGNGVMDFWNLTIDFTGNIRPEFNTTEPLHMTVKVGSDGNVDSINAAGVAGGSNQKVVGDMNGDGIPDVMMLANSGNDSHFLTSLVSNGNSSSFSRINSQIVKDGFPNHLRALNITPVGDANGDGYIDVVAAAYPDYRELRYQTMELIFLDGDYQQKGAPVTLFDQYDHDGIAFHLYSPTIVDMDNDGDLDIVVSAPFAPNGGALYIRYYE